MWSRRKLACWALTAVVGVGALGVSAATAATAAPPPSPSPNSAYTTAGSWSFKSAPNLHPPKLTTDAPVRSRKLTPGYFLLGSFKNLTDPGPMMGQGGPLIVTNGLQPVWFLPDCIQNCQNQDIWTQNLEQQTYQGQPVLSWWEGALSATGVTLSGEIYVVNEHYRTIATLTGADGWIVDSHDLVISGHDAWVSMTKNVPMDLRPYGGSQHGSVVDTAVQEYDLRNGQLLYTWDPLKHIPLSDSYTKPAPNGTPWDAYHLNSIQLQGANGTFLAGFRNTWSAYQVTISTGAVKWVLGGKDKTYTHFTFGPGAAFEWQHNVVLHRFGMVTVFDDACCAIAGVKNGVAQFAPPTGPARGLVLKLNFATHTATLRYQYVRAPNFYVAFTGSMQLLPLGRLPFTNVLVGWGSKPYFSEYSKAGALLLDAVWPSTDLSYRALLTQSWVGTPYFPPSGSVQKHAGHSTVYASWDGATQVAKWEVLAGKPGHLKPVATVAKSGFETAIHLKRAYLAYEVSALAANGHVLRTSGMFPTTSSPTFNPGAY